MYGVVGYFEHAVELECKYISDPQKVRLYILYPCEHCALHIQNMQVLTHKRNTDNKHLLPLISKHLM